MVRPKHIDEEKEYENAFVDAIEEEELTDFEDSDEEVSIVERAKWGICSGSYEGAEAGENLLGVPGKAIGTILGGVFGVAREIGNSMR